MSKNSKAKKSERTKPLAAGELTTAASETQARRRIAIYTRVSTDLQANKEDGSLDNQQRRLERYAREHLDPGSIAVYRDEGESGKSLERPQMQRMLHDMRTGKLDAIAVTRLDRLSRSLRDFLFLTEEAEKLHVDLVVLDQHIDTTTPFGRMFANMLLLLAQFEREQTGARTKAGIRGRAESGLFNGGRIPLGYRSMRNGLLAVDDAEAEVVRSIFAKFVEVGSAPKVARWLSEQGHRQKPNKSDAETQALAPKHSPGTVRTILRNRIYLGEAKHKGNTFPGQHEPIVDAATFVRVQMLFERNGRRQYKTSRKERHDYLLTGVARCSCGYALTTSAGTGGDGQVRRYYRCTTKTKRVDDVCGYKGMRNAARLEGAVVSVLREVLKDGDLLSEAAVQANEQAAARIGPLRDEIARKERELAKVNRQGKATYERVMRDGLLDLPWARDELDDLTRQRTDLARSIRASQEQVAVESAKHIDLDGIRAALADFDRLWPHLTGPEAKEVVRLVVREVRVHDDGTMDVDLFEGRTLRATMPPKGKPRGDRGKRSDAGFVSGSDWLRQQDSNLETETVRRVEDRQRIADLGAPGSA